MNDLLAGVHIEVWVLFTVRWAMLDTVPDIYVKMIEVRLQR